MSISENKWFRISATALVVVAGLYVLTLTLLTWKEGRGSAVDGVPTISVSGTGEVFAVPDTASFTFSVSEEDKSVKVAQGRATTKINAAIDYLKSKGIEEKFIKTVGYNVYPRYDAVLPRQCTQFSCPPSQQVVSGYEVQQSIEVKVEDPTLAGELLTGIGIIDISTVSGITFTVDDEQELQREARQKAIVDAEANARQLARDLGVRIVRIRSFNENGGGYPYPLYARAEMSSDGKATNQALPPQVPTGENKISSTVSVVYEIR